MNEIRHAEEKDIGEILVMGRMFFDESPFTGFSTFDVDSFHATVIALISGSAEGSLLVVDTGSGLSGMAASVIYPLYFNLKTLIGQEIFWFMKPEHRNGIGDTLLDELEADSMNKGAVVFMSASLAGGRDKAFERLYRRRGYAPAENSYMRKLSS